jgi:histidyl-tRNA synthetase
MGVDRIVLAMPEGPAAGPDVMVVVADPVRRDQALSLLAALRGAGLRADMDLGERSLKAQFRAAARRAAATVAVVGEEWADGSVTVRRMDTGEETVIPIEEVAAWTTGR